VSPSCTLVTKWAADYDPMGLPADPRKPKWWKDGPVPNAMEDQLHERLVVRDNEMYSLNKCE
jgi:hypothetical protein